MKYYLICMYFKNLFINFLILFKCNKHFTYSECSYDENYYYNKCIIYLNSNDTNIIEKSLYNTGGYKIYGANDTFIIPRKKKCDKNTNIKMYKSTMDQSLDVTKCFINYKNKIHHNDFINCNRINNNIDYKKRYQCLIN